MTSLNAVAGRVQRDVLRQYQAERAAIAEEYRQHAGDDPGAAMILFAKRFEALAARYADRTVEEVARALRLNRRSRRAAASDLEAIRRGAYQLMLPGGKTAADVAAQLAASEEIDTDFADALAAIAEIPK